MQRIHITLILCVRCQARLVERGDINGLMALACLRIYPCGRLVLLIFHKGWIAIQVLRNLDSILFHAYKARLDQILQLKA